MSARPKLHHRNVAVVVGTIAREPEVRDLPDGTSVTELDVRVAVEGEPSATVPVSWPAGPADLAEGAEVVVVGRVRRRFYRAGGNTVSRTDVLAEVVVPVHPAERAAAALEAATTRLAS